MLQGDIVNAEITGLNNEGEGIARIGENEFVLFVPDALPGEKVSARIVTLKKSYGTAKVLKRFCNSPDRIAPRCPDFGKCGGCQLQHMNYAAQLRLKKQTVCDALSRIGGIENPPVLECIPSPSEWRYRNKAAVPVQKNFKSRLTLGFYKKRSHDVVEFRQCPVLFPEMETEILALKKFLEEKKINGYDEKQPKNGGNFLRHLVLRFAKFSGEAAGCMVVNRLPEGKEKAVLAEISRVSHLDGLLLNKNDAPGNFIWGGVFRRLFGSSGLTEKLGSFKFASEISSFFQINTEQALNLYKYAAEKAGECGAENVLELYAGIGTLTCFLAEKAKKVTAVESWRAASKYIAVNAKANGFDNVRVFEDRAEKISQELSGESFDTVVLDPPRTGCDKSVLDAILKISPHCVIYVSCNPATLARDCKMLLENGAYELKSAQPFDMFPQTGHVESVILLTKVHD
ncbi:MAG: 23S rRNA (uracil(1939)-C(5))-methyltransferase RlmD [Synergistaceae bacterium]|nr:23S rRNA (uracil(1939)-C(5))-methyltransferase RlmD [Candidatus Equadaptatus faecalis]